MKSLLKNYRQSPRKVRLVARAISGKSAQDATLILDFMPKRSALPIKKLIDSAVANAKVNSGIEVEDLMVKSIEINKGVTLKRMRPRARGSGFPINKRTSHIVVTLEAKKDGKSKNTINQRESSENKIKTDKVVKSTEPEKKTEVKKMVKKPKIDKEEEK